MVCDVSMKIGHLCLTDFGFAKKTDEGDASTRTMCGTLQYMVLYQTSTGDHSSDNNVI
jgi:serine/threonine protein kinase